MLTELNALLLISVQQIHVTQLPHVSMEQLRPLANVLLVPKMMVRGLVLVLMPMNVLLALTTVPIVPPVLIPTQVSSTHVPMDSAVMISLPPMAVTNVPTLTSVMPIQYNVPPTQAVPTAMVLLIAIVTQVSP